MLAYHGDEFKTRCALLKRKCKESPHLLPLPEREIDYALALAERAGVFSLYPHVSQNQMLL